MEMDAQKSEDTQLIDKDEDSDDENSSPCRKFPLSILFIVVNEFCERFCYYGMRAVLVLYLTQHVHIKSYDAMALYHLWVVLTYVTPLLGGYVSDNYLGKFNTIVSLSIVYAIGTVIMSLTALPAPNIAGPVIGLLLIALGSGGIKSCTSALGGDQIPPHRIRVLEGFFSAFYFTINAGSVLASLIVPLLRADVHCNGETTCYPLAFGSSSILMGIAIVVFIAGKKRYIIRPPTPNITFRFIQCSWYGFKNYLRTRKKVEKDSWMDYADDKYEKREINDFKVVNRIIILFLPLAIFWSLFDQQGSRWTLQAKALDGHLFNGVTILPDQMQAMNPILILVFIPLFESVFYPLVSKCHIPNKPLRRITAGLILTVTSFTLAGFLQMQIERQGPQTPAAGHSDLQFLSVQPGCSLRSTNFTDLTTDGAFHISKTHDVKAGPATLPLQLVCKDGKTYTATVGLNFKSKTKYVLYGWVVDNKLEHLLLKSRLEKDRQAFPVIRFVFMKDTLGTGVFEFVSKKGKVISSISVNKNSTNVTVTHHLVVTGYEKVKRNKVHIRYRKLNQTLDLGKKKLYSGEVSTFLPHKVEVNTWSIYTVNEAPPNEISILWQIPQYVIMTAAEVLVSITGLSFSYSEAPATLKATVSAIWLVYVGLGNLIVAIVSEINLVPIESWNYMLFASLCALTTIIFVFLAYNYIPASPNDQPLNGQENPGAENVETEGSKQM